MFSKQILHTVTFPFSYTKNIVLVVYIYKFHLFRAAHLISTNYDFNKLINYKSAYELDDRLRGFKSCSAIADIRLLNHQQRARMKSIKNYHRTLHRAYIEKWSRFRRSLHTEQLSTHNSDDFFFFLRTRSFLNIVRGALNIHNYV